MPPKQQRGAFITFEGTEGAGKSTLIRAVAPFFGDRAVITREPGGIPTAEKIREVILKEPMSPWTELFLYEAARAEHLDHVIRPRLEAGNVVLCDRFTDSTLAYQAFARGLPWKEVEQLNRIATQGVKPDLTVLLDIDPALGLARVRERNRFEEEGLAFQKRVRQGYLKAMKADRKRWLVIRPGSKSPGDLAKEVVEGIHERLKWLNSRKRK
jgi:dTMP kinase